MGSAREGSNPSGVAFACNRGFMAEWSKALDSSSSLHLKAWVRIPLEPVLPQHTGPCGAMDSALDFGSSGCRFESCQGRLLYTAPWGISSIGRVRALQARGTGIETPILHFIFVCASVAQWIARQTSNLKVVGSTPIRGVLIKLLQVKLGFALH